MAVDSMPLQLDWQWRPLAWLTPRQVYAWLAARQSVFVVEQACAYQDIDGHDLDAEHLLAWSAGSVAAALRLLDPGTTFAEASLGRIFTSREFRGIGLGRELMRRGLARIEQRFPAVAVRLGAQAHLARFYGEFGFVKASAPYLEDGIPHIEMLRAPLRATAV